MTGIQNKILPCLIYRQNSRPSEVQGLNENDEPGLLLPRAKV